MEEELSSSANSLIAFLAADTSEQDMLISSDLASGTTILEMSGYKPLG